MVIDWTPRARFDLSAIVEYTKSESPAGAKRMRDRILKRIGDLPQFPDQGVARGRGLRRLDVARTPYLVIYRVRGDVITIIAILHGGRNRRS